MINQRNSTINLTSVTFSQIQGLNFAPSHLISFEGSIYSNLKFNFSSYISNKEYLINILQGTLIWVDSENKLDSIAFFSVKILYIINLVMDMSMLF